MRQRPRFLIYLSFLLVYSLLYAQEKSKEVSPEETARWSRWEKGMILVRPGLQATALNMSFFDSLTERQLRYSPASPFNAGMTLGYDDYSVSYFLNTPLHLKYDFPRGDSTRQDFQFRMHGDQWSFLLFYQTYKGYAIGNPTENGLSAPADVSSPTWRDDLTTSHLGTTVIYVFRPEQFSLGAAFNQNKKQITSGGTPLATGGFHNHWASASSPFIPSTLRLKYLGVLDLQSFRTYSLSVGGGYGYSWVNKDFYASAVGLLSIGGQYGSFENTSGKSDAFNLALNGSLYVGAGYNGDRYIFGTQVMMDDHMLKIPNGNVSMFALEALLFFGVRFTAEPSTSSL